MAKRRMFDIELMESDAFLELPHAAQVLYVHLCLNADDEGFLSCAKKLARIVDAPAGTLDTLREAGFLLIFESGVCAIRHWRISNKIRPDRLSPTAHRAERERLVFIEGDGYRFSRDVQTSAPCQPHDNQTAAVCQPHDGQTSAPCQPHDGQTSAVCLPYDGQTSAFCQPDGNPGQDRSGQDSSGQDSSDQDRSDQLRSAQVPAAGGEAAASFGSPVGYDEDEYEEEEEEEETEEDEKEEGAAGGTGEKPVYILLPARDGDYAVTREATDRLAAQFPNVNVRQQLLRMQCWCDANKDRRTRDSTPAFIANWLTREAEKNKSAPQKSGASYDIGLAETRMKTAVPRLVMREKR